MVEYYSLYNKQTNKQKKITLVLIGHIAKVDIMLQFEAVVNQCLHIIGQQHRDLIECFQVMPSVQMFNVYLQPFLYCTLLV